MTHFEPVSRVLLRRLRSNWEQLDFSQRGSTSLYERLRSFLKGSYFKGISYWRRKPISSVAYCLSVRLKSLCIVSKARTGQAVLTQRFRQDIVGEGTCRCSLQCSDRVTASGPAAQCSKINTHETDKSRQKGKLLVIRMPAIWRDGGLSAPPLLKTSSRDSAQP